MHTLVSQSQRGERQRRTRNETQRRPAAQARGLTFVVGGVVDAEVPVPDDGQLHGKTAHLHAAVEVLSPWQPEGSEDREINL